MKKYLLFLTALSLMAGFDCQDRYGSDEKNKLKDEQREYSLIRDNLFTDDNGTLYLKSVNNEDMENHTKFDVWLKEVHCDTCRTPTENGWKDITELKDFVDVNSFRWVMKDLEQGADIYEDKNYRYYHKWMADGGVLSVVRK